jgi:hypothetical protein
MAGKPNARTAVGPCHRRNHARQAFRDPGLCARNCQSSDGSNYDHGRRWGSEGVGHGHAGGECSCRVMDPHSELFPHTDVVVTTEGQAQPCRPSKPAFLWSSNLPNGINEWSRRAAQSRSLRDAALRTSCATVERLLSEKRTATMQSDSARF